METEDSSEEFRKTLSPLSMKTFISVPEAAEAEV